MGLDVVELVMRCEEVFAIELRDEDMERVQTVGDLYTAVCKELRLTPHPNQTITQGWTRISRASLNPHPPAWTAEDVWATLRATVVNQLQVDEKDVVPSAHFQYDLRAD
jgi:acyl carrier protein